MRPLQYHDGQRAVQDEANTRDLADHLAHWNGPVAEFAAQADLFVLAARDRGRDLRASVLSGAAPLATPSRDGRFLLRFPPGAEIPPEGRAGGLAINLGLLRRVRINGRLRHVAGGVEVEADEGFTLCRKYMAPSVMAGAALGEGAHAGPAARSPLALADPVVAPLLARAETSFLLSIAPDGGPDVAHRGGPPGFLSLDPARGELSWPEFLGDGVFKSAGNVRATGALTLLVPDPETGDGIELVCRDGRYENVLTSRKRRLDPLVQHPEKYPVQGRITARVVSATRLHALMRPRTRIERALKVTSQSDAYDQAPQ